MPHRVPQIPVQRVHRKSALDILDSAGQSSANTMYGYMYRELAISPCRPTSCDPARVVHSGRALKPNVR